MGGREGQEVDYPAMQTKIKTRRLAFGELVLQATVGP